MSYEKHLTAALKAFFDLYSDVSPRALSLKAGVSRGWVSEFMLSGTASFAKADLVLRAMLTHASEVGDADREAGFRQVANLQPAAFVSHPSAHDAQTERGAA